MVLSQRGATALPRDAGQRPKRPGQDLGRHGFAGPGRPVENESLWGSYSPQSERIGLPQDFTVSLELFLKRVLDDQVIPGQPLLGVRIGGPVFSSAESKRVWRLSGAFERDV
jgi:hypothetical protein